MQFWDPKTAKAQFMLQGHKNSVISVAVSPVGGMVATGSGDWTSVRPFLPFSSIVADASSFAAHLVVRADSQLSGDCVGRRRREQTFSPLLFLDTLPSLLFPLFRVYRLLPPPLCVDSSYTATAKAPALLLCLGFASSRTALVVLLPPSRAASRLISALTLSRLYVHKLTSASGGTAGTLSARQRFSQ